jgi:hypothetical protein
MREHLQRLLRHVRLQRAIAAKWRRDRQVLPLVAAHRELYFNIHRAFWTSLGSFPQLAPPRTRNEAIQWCKLFDQRPEHIQCCDKLAVRDLVRARAGEQHVVPLLQVCDRFDQIDFDALPDAFVIKPNHDAGSTILVRNKAALDRGDAARRIGARLRRRYGWTKGEWAYAYVRPRVLVEEFLEPEAPSPPPDYKFHCDGGRVLWCGYHYDRGRDVKVQQVDRDGASITGVRLDHRFGAGTAFVRPPEWDRMIELAEALAAGFRMLRVDLYRTGGRILVGELTVWPVSGFSDAGLFNRPGFFGDIAFDDPRPPLLPSLGPPGNPRARRRRS